MSVHILRDIGWYRAPPWASHERLSSLSPDDVVVTDCCVCRMRADETVCVIRFPPHVSDPCRMPHVKWMKDHPRWDAYREPRDWWMSYFDPVIDLKCGPGFGCQANPRRKRGAEMRRWWRQAA